MHIPSCPTCKMDIIDFASAYRNACIPNKEYEKLAGIFNPIYFDAEEWVKSAKNACSWVVRQLWQRKTAS